MNEKKFVYKQTIRQYVKSAFTFDIDFWNKVIIAILFHFRHAEFVQSLVDRSRLFRQHLSSRRFHRSDRNNLQRSHATSNNSFPIFSLSTSHNRDDGVNFSHCRNCTRKVSGQKNMF